MKYSVVFAIFWMVVSSQVVLGQAEVAPVPDQLRVELKNSKPDTSRVRLFMAIGQDHLHYSHIPKADLDSAMAYSDSVILLSRALHKDTLENEGYILKGYCYFRMNNYVQGQAFFMKVINHYHAIGNIGGEAEKWGELGDVITWGSKERDESKINYYQQAVSLYQRKNDPVTAAMVQKKIADVYLNAGNFNEAETQLLAVLAKFKELHYKNLHGTYDLLAAVARVKGDVEKELFYRIEVIKSVEATGDSAHAMEYYGKLARTYSSLGMHDKAAVYYRKALSSSGSEFYRFYFFRYTGSLTDNLLAQGKVKEALGFIDSTRQKMPALNIQDRVFIDQALGNCYLKLDQLSVANQYYLHSAKICDSGYRIKLVGLNDYFSDYLSIANLLVATRHFKEAVFYLKKLSALPGDRFPLLLISNFEWLQYQTDSAFMDFRSAIGHYKKYAQLKDSIFNVAETKKIDQIQYQFETEKKDEDLLVKTKNIDDLTKRNLIQEKLVKQTLLIRNLVIGGLAMLLLLLGIGYNRYQLKQRSNLLLQKQRQEIDQQNKSLQELNTKQKALITEKEWLLREIHHRVKNNLQTSMSLLNIQSTHLSNTEALSAIKDSQRRMHAMALIHQRLYQSDNLARIDMEIYIKELVAYLVESFGSPGDIKVCVLVQPMKLDVEQAVPLGLIINEGVTNALKYAFPSGSSGGTIDIVLENGLEEAARLVIRDNGVGFVVERYESGNTSLGIKLMKGLAEQLQGTCDLQGSAGTRIAVAFRVQYLEVG